MHERSTNGHSEHIAKPDKAILNRITKCLKMKLEVTWEASLSELLQTSQPL